MRTIFAILISFAISLQCFSTDVNPKEESINNYVNNYSSDIYLYYLTRYLYRWYLDEIDIEKNVFVKNIDFLIRELNPKLDKDDKSQYAEIIIPMYCIAVTLKKSDYILEETGQEVKSNGFKVINVARINMDDFNQSDFTSVSLEIAKLKEYLFKTRNHEEYPSRELLERIRKTFKNQLAKLKKDYSRPISEERDNIIHLAPLSPIGNDVWFYWENGKIVIHCNSDIDISNYKIWEHEEIYFDYYDVYNNTVVSLSESALSNEYLTRDQVGRILFNCIVLGKRVSVAPSSPEVKQK